MDAATGGSWYDDYGWWALANLRTAQQKQLFGDDAEQFYANSIQGWEKMTPCATVWNRATSISKFQAVTSAGDHGAWNHPYDPADNSVYNPLNPHADPLAGKPPYLF